MSNNKIVLLLFLLCFGFIESVGQNSRFKDERRIYLWDVTLSIKGYQDKTPDIYDEVIDAIEQDVNTLNDENTEIWVIPFQDKILDRWQFKATSKGKKELVKKIKSFENNDVTYTNISSPMEEVMNTLISPDKRNVLILLTDGVQNDPDYPKEKLHNLIRKWCSFAEAKDAYAFYVMLTQFAKDDKLLDIIDETCRIKVTNGTTFTHVELYPQSNCKYNIKDDEGKGVVLGIERKKNVEIPADLKIRCFCEDNPYIEINQVASVKNDKLNIEIKHKKKYDSLKMELPQEQNKEIKVYFEIENSSAYPLVGLLNNECSLELINKPEKTLKVYVKN